VGRRGKARWGQGGGSRNLSCFQGISGALGTKGAAKKTTAAYSSLLKSRDRKKWGKPGGLGGKKTVGPGREARFPESTGVDASLKGEKEIWRVIMRESRNKQQREGKKKRNNKKRKLNGGIMKEEG